MENIYSENLPDSFVTPNNWHFKSRILNTYPIIYEASYGDFSSVKELVNLGVDINAKGDCDRTALHEAASRGSYDVVQLLLENGAEKSIRSLVNNETASEIAYSDGHSDIAELIDKWPNIEISIEIEYIKAIYIKLGFFDSIEEINKPNEFGEFPLHIAVLRHNPAEVNAFLSAGANIDALTEGSWPMTALHYAIGQADAEIMKILLRNNANHSIVCGQGYSPLDLAFLIGETKQLFFLYEWIKKNPMLDP